MCVKEGIASEYSTILLVNDIICLFRMSCFLCVLIYGASFQFKDKKPNYLWLDVLRQFVLVEELTPLPSGDNHPDNDMRRPIWVTHYPVLLSFLSSMALLTLLSSRVQWENPS